MVRNLKVGDKLRHPGYSKDHTLTVMGILAEGPSGWGKDFVVAIDVRYKNEARGPAFCRLDGTDSTGNVAFTAIPPKITVHHLLYKLLPHGTCLLATSSTDVNHVNEWEQSANRLGATFKIVKIWSEEVEVPEEE